MFYFLFSFPFSSSRFYRYIFCKVSRTLPRPLGGTKGFKSLVTYAKCNGHSCESELDPYNSFSLFFSRTDKNLGVGEWWTSILTHFGSLLIHFSHCFHVDFRWKKGQVDLLRSYFAYKVIFRIFRSFCWANEIFADASRKQGNGDELQDQEEVVWSSKAMARDLARIPRSKWHGRATSKVSVGYVLN